MTRVMARGHVSEPQRTRTVHAFWPCTLNPRTPSLKEKLVVAGSIVPVVLVLDFFTKRWALEALADGRQIPVIPGFFSLTLAFNRGAAFGLEVGSNPRTFFILVTVLALGLLGALYVKAEPGDRLRHVSLALVLAGALGNLYDRVRWSRGVVDFLGPMNLGFTNFPIFNVADMAISCGAALLAVSFWLEERAEAEARAATAALQPTPES